MTDAFPAKRQTFEATGHEHATPRDRPGAQPAAARAFPGAGGGR